MKMYIAILDRFPDYMAPTLVAHAVLGAHIRFNNDPDYIDWLENSFKKCVVRVNQKEFDKIQDLQDVYRGYERNTLDGVVSCLVVKPRREIPNVLKFSKLWKPM